tara:strand:- start:904 stop:1350 length:447 start_codon:yes stop_codon:yes gene_type:complete
MQGAISGEVGIRLGKPHLDSQEEKTAFTSRERTGPRWVCGFSLFMKATPEWVHEPEAAKLLVISHGTLRSMRRDGRLTPGDHFIFATATSGGPVVYNVNAIRESLAQRTKEMVAAELQRREKQKQARKAAIEIYGEDGMDQLIAEVRS